MTCRTQSKLVAKINLLSQVPPAPSLELSSSSPLHAVLGLAVTGLIVDNSSSWIY